MAKKNVAVVMGGYSSEYQISLNSGAIVCDSIDKSIYNVYAYHILKEGWFCVEVNGEKHEINKADFGFNIDDNYIIPHVIFNTIHGTPGEDGKLQAYWELLGIPQTSTNYYQSALSFNKRDCLSVLKTFGIRCANSYYINKGNEIDVESIITKVGLPCFVKPNRAGSSFGVSKVYTVEEFLPAVEKAFVEDSEIIVETGLKGPEISVGVYINEGEIIALPCTEIVTENDFFDYEAKYLGKSEEITPARITEDETAMLQAEAKQIYRILNMKGVTRTDFIIQDGKPYFIETNTCPGLSSESIIPKQARNAGMTLTQFFSILLQEALNSKYK